MQFRTSYYSFELVLHVCMDSCLGTRFNHSPCTVYEFYNHYSVLLIHIQYVLLDYALSHPCYLCVCLRRIFGPKRDEVAGEWRKLHNKELHDLYFLTSIIRIIKT
jgi:hypothetical protein